MLLIEFLIAGGVVYIGTNTFKTRHKKKRLVYSLQIQPKSEKKNEIIFSPLVDKTKTAIQKFKQNKVAPFLGETRRQQLQAISSAADQPEMSEAKTKARPDLVVSLTSLGLAIAGALVYPPLGLLSVPGFIYATIPLHKNTFNLLKKGKVGVDTLATITTVGCIVQGYFVIGNLSCVFFGISKRLLSKVQSDSKKNLIDVFRQQPRQVWVLANGIEVEIPFEALKVGDIIVVHAGEVVPADGMITDGMASIDQHILTGEAQPVEKEVNDQVFASTVVLSGQICISVEKAGADTTVAQIGEILNQTADFKSTTQLQSEHLADRTVLPTLIIGGLSLPLLGPNGALAVINAHFKYKMRTIAPISILNFLNMASQNGILVKDGRTLDLLNQVDTIVFDKTGTLTEEQPHVGQIYICAEYDENALLTYAAAAEYKQTHPIARAIQEESQARQLNIPRVDNAEYKVGYGLTVVIDSQLVQVGSGRFMALSNIYIPSNIKEIWTFCHNQGHSLVMVAINARLVGAIELLPTIRPEARVVISQLRQRQNIKSMYIISGDHETPTRKLAHDLNIDHYFAETLPEDKAALIEQLQNEGKFVCYIGDGINDTIALKKSQMSVSLRGASTVATDTAQVILMDGSLSQLCYLFDLSQKFEANMRSTFTVILIPMIIGMGGALFLHFGLIYTIILNQVSLVVGISCVMAPWIRYQWKRP